MEHLFHFTLYLLSSTLVVSSHFLFQSRPSTSAPQKFTYRAYPSGLQPIPVLAVVDYTGKNGPIWHAAQPISNAGNLPVQDDVTLNSSALPPPSQSTLSSGLYPDALYGSSTETVYFTTTDHTTTSTTTATSSPSTSSVVPPEIVKTTKTPIVVVQGTTPPSTPPSHITKLFVHGRIASQCSCISPKGETWQIFYVADKIQKENNTSSEEEH